MSASTIPEEEMFTLGNSGAFTILRDKGSRMWGSSGGALNKDLPLPRAPIFNQDERTVAGYLKYNRTPLSAKEQEHVDTLSPAEADEFMIARPLAEYSQQRADRHESECKAHRKEQETNEASLMQYIYDRIPPEILPLLRIHPDYKNVVDAPLDSRVYILVKLLEAFLLPGNLYFARDLLKQLVNLDQLPETPLLTHYKTLSDLFDRVQMALEDKANPGYIHVGVLKSIIVLASVNQDCFAVPLSNIVQGDSTGHIKDPTKIVDILVAYDRSRMRVPSQLTETTTFASLAARDVPRATAAAAPVLEELPACRWCLLKGLTYHNHTAFACCYNPANHGQSVEDPNHPRRKSKSSGKQKRGASVAAHNPGAFVAEVMTPEVYQNWLHYYYDQAEEELQRVLKEQGLM